jgi:hypothetical protein
MVYSRSEHEPRDVRHAVCPADLPPSKVDRAGAVAHTKIDSNAYAKRPVQKSRAFFIAFVSQSVAMPAVNE